MRRYTGQESSDETNLQKPKSSTDVSEGNNSDMQWVNNSRSRYRGQNTTKTNSSGRVYFINALMRLFRMRLLKLFVILGTVALGIYFSTTILNEYSGNQRTESLQREDIGFAADVANGNEQLINQKAPVKQWQEQVHNLDIPKLHVNEHGQQNLQQKHQDNIKQGIVHPRQNQFNQGPVHPQQDNFNQRAQHTQQGNFHQGAVHPHQDKLNQGAVRPQQGNFNQGAVHPQQDKLNQGAVHPQQGNFHQGAVHPQQDKLNQGAVHPQQGNFNQGAVHPLQDKLNQGAQHPQQGNFNQDAEQRVVHPPQNNLNHNFNQKVAQPQQNNIKQGLVQPQQQQQTYYVLQSLTNTQKMPHLKQRFVDCTISILDKASVDLHFFFVVDEPSKAFITATLQDITDKGIAKSKFQFNFLDVDDLAKELAPYMMMLQEHVSGGHPYYKDAIFFLSVALHKGILPEFVQRVIMLDTDLKFMTDIQHLFDFFPQFTGNNIIGLAHEQQPVYRHMLSLYRSRNKGTSVGGPPPDGRTGFNSGVILLDFEKIRNSKAYAGFLGNNVIKMLAEKYFFKGHLGDQDFFSLISLEEPDLFYVLPCTWNRQLCRWWQDKGYKDVFDQYFTCEGQINVYHGNCNTPINV